MKRTHVNTTIRELESDTLKTLDPLTVYQVEFVGTGNYTIIRDGKTVSVTLNEYLVEYVENKGPSK